MEFQPIIETADFLGQREIVERLQNLAALKEKNQFFLTFWGEFSAGKTHLINTILGKKLLPVHISETTAVPTFIRYGEQEKATAWYTDGTGEDIAVELLQELWHASENAERLDRIDHLDVQMPSELLKTGLVIVDTPGINTTVERHQTAALTAVESSGKIVYVLGGAITQAEIGWLRYIRSHGVDIIFARTKCDLINNAEENPQETLQQEKKLLEDICDGEVGFYPVSSESGWEQELERFLIRLQMETADIQELNEVCCHKEAVRIAQLCMEQLGKRMLDLQSAVDGDTERLNEQKQACEQKRALLQQEIRTNSDRVAAAEQRAERQAQKRLDEQRVTLNDAFERGLPNDTGDDSYSNVIDHYYTDALDHAVQVIKETLYNTMDEWVQENNAELETISADATAARAIVPASYAEVEQQNSLVVQNCRNQLEACQNALAEIRQKRQETAQKLDDLSDEDIGAYQAALQEIDEQLAEIPSAVEMKEVEPAGTKPSAVLSKIGSAVDIALFFLPGDAIVAGAKGLAEVTKVSSKLPKIAKAINSNKVLGPMLEATIKGVNQIDRTHDQLLGLRAFQKINTKRAQKNADKYAQKVAKTSINAAADYVGDIYKQAKANHQTGESDGGLLDMISVEYWARKIGKAFDPKPILVVDQDVEGAKAAARRQLTAQRKTLMQDELRKQQELGLLQSAEEQLKWKEARKLQDMKCIEQEMQRQEESIRKAARQAQICKLQKDYSASFCTNMETLSQKISAQFFAVALRNMGLYSKQQLVQLEVGLQQVEKDLDELLNSTPDSLQKHRNELEQCVSHQAALKQYLC